MKLQDIKLHDTISVSKQGKQSWDNYKYIGVVTELTGNEHNSVVNITIKQESGEEKSFSLLSTNGKIIDEKTNDDKYTYTLGNVSELKFIEIIEDTIDIEKLELQNKKKEIEKITEWLKVYKQQISLFGKLKRFLQDNLTFQNEKSDKKEK